MRPAALLLCLACLACRSTVGAPPPPPFEEAPVREDLNDNFLSEDLDVESFVDRFEGESREIARYRRRIADAVGIEPGMRVADIGAGTGLFEPLFLERAGPEGHVFAVDISEVFVARLSERLAAEGIPNATAVLCTERSAQLAGDSVERAFICDTYHHFTYPQNTLASLRHALTPGGELLVVDFERIEGVTRAWLLDHVRAGKEVFRAEIEQAGFEFVEEVEIEGLEENYALRFRNPAGS